MLQIPSPHDGCFVAEHPDMTWKELPCNTQPAPLHPMPRETLERGSPPRAPEMNRSAEVVPDDVGGASGDYSALVPGLIANVTGTFPSVTATSSEDFTLQVESV